MSKNESFMDRVGGLASAVVKAGGQMMMQNTVTAALDTHPEVTLSAAKLLSRNDAPEYREVIIEMTCDLVNLPWPAYGPITEQALLSRSRAMGLQA